MVKVLPLLVCRIPEPRVAFLVFGSGKIICTGARTLDDIHTALGHVGHALKKARKQVQNLLGAAHDSEIIFTSCGTESDSTAILSALKAQPARREIITTNVEHPAVLALCEHLEKDGYITNN